MIKALLSRLFSTPKAVSAQAVKDTDIYGREISDAEVFFYPRPVHGLPLASTEVVLRKYKPKLQELKQRIPIGDHHKTNSGTRVVDELYWDVIKRLIEFVHLIPASEDHHHCGPGGLFYHSLDASIYSLRATASRNFETTGMVDLDREMEPRAKYAAWLGGLVHDLGKVLGDIIVHAVTKFDAHGQVVQAHENDIPRWHPELETLFEWAKRHRVITYTVSFDRKRKHNRHNIDTVLLLKQVVGSGYAMSYLTTGPVNLYRQLGAVLTKYESNTDFLSICVREGDVYSTARDLTVHVRPNTGSAQLSTATRIYRSLKEARKEWDWNQRGKEGWVIGGQTYLRWPIAIESIIKQSIKYNVSIPHNPKTVVSIMEENGMLKKAEGNQLTLKFTPGNYTQADANKIMRGEKEVVWEELLLITWNGTVFDTDPLPGSARGIIYYAESRKMMLADDSSNLTQVEFDAETKKLLNIKTSDSASKKPAEGSDNESVETAAQVGESEPELAEPTSTKAEETSKPQKSKPAKKKDTETKEVKPANEPTIAEPEIDLSTVKQSKSSAPTAGIKFVRPTKPEAQDKKPVPEAVAGQTETAKEAGSAANPSSTTQAKAASKKKEPVTGGVKVTVQAKPSIQQLINANISFIKTTDEKVIFVLVDQLKQVFGEQYTSVVSSIKAEKMLHVDMNNPTKLTFSETLNGIPVEVVRIKKMAERMLPAHLVRSQASDSPSETPVSLAESMPAPSTASTIKTVGETAESTSLGFHLAAIPKDQLQSFTKMSSGELMYQRTKMSTYLRKHTKKTILMLDKALHAHGITPVNKEVDGVEYKSIPLSAMKSVHFETPL